LTSSELEKIDEVVKEELQNNTQPTIKILVKKPKDNTTKELPEYTAIEIPVEEIENIAKNNSVEMIYLDQEYDLLIDYSVPQIKTPVAWDMNYTGLGIKVAVLDTGIDYNNSAFEDRVVLSKAFTGENHTIDNIGHGTHVAGIIASNGEYKGVAPNALLLNAKVLSDEGYGSTSTIIEGIKWAVENNADIISLSLGRKSENIDAPLFEVLEYAINKGVVVVVASGNCGSCGSCNGFNGVTNPGNFEEVITVGAINDYNEIACFSSGSNYTNYTKPNIVAPGVDIMSTHLNNNFKSLSGTSMATPHVAGVVALLLEKNPSLNHYDVKSLLQNNAIDLGNEGKDIYYGSGGIDVGVLLGTYNKTNNTIKENNSFEDYEGYWVVINENNESVEKPICPKNYSGYDPNLGLSKQEFSFLFEDCLFNSNDNKSEIKKQQETLLQETLDYNKSSNVMIKVPFSLKRYIPSNLYSSFYFFK
jgi:subtilisin family serine protease